MSDSQWYYAAGDQHQGPVPWEQLQQMAREGQLTPQQLIWREGMPQWAPAASVEGLFEGVVPIVPVPVAYARPIDAKTQKILKNAKQNCIALFVIFCIAAPFALMAAVTTPSRMGSWRYDSSTSGAGCAVCLWPLASLFAMIYLPVRWRYLKQISGVFRTLGLIGGFGLIGLTLVWILGAVIMMLTA